MAYESPEYQKLKDEIWRLEKIKGFVDMARAFEHMKYLGKMRVEAQGKIGPYDPETQPEVVDVPDYLKVEVINAAVAWCVGQAKAITKIERKDFDIEPCIKV